MVQLYINDTASCSEWEDPCLFLVTSVINLTILVVTQLRYKFNIMKMF